MIFFKRLMFAFGVSGCLVFAASAQQIGVGFVDAPEQSSGVCFAENPDKAFKCARQKCAANGTLKEDCYRVRWCYPAGWSADLFVQHREGPHWHEYLCGWQSRQDLLAAAKILCEGSLGEYLIECAVVRVWDPDGKKAVVEE